MNRLKSLYFLLVLLLATLSLASCSGPFKGGFNGGGGTGSVIVTVTSTPSQTFFFPYLAWDITAIVLIDGSGNQTTIVQAPLPPLDFARLQTDSQYLNNKTFPATVAAGTYTSVKIQLAPSSDTSYVFNNTGGTLFTGCATAGMVCPIPMPSTNKVPGFAATTVTVPVNFTVANNSGFSLNFDLSKAVTTAGGMTFDFTKTGAITLSTLPRKGQMTGSLDLLENFTGIVSAKTSTTIDMFSISSATRTFTIASNAEFDDPFNVCGGSNNFSCLALNQNISVDAVVNSDATLTAYEVEFLDKSATEIEGVIVTPVSNNQFQMVVTNGMPVNAVFFPGTLVTVTVNGASTYFADPKNLVITTNPPTGFTSSSNLVVGQSVMLQGGTQDSTNFKESGYTRTLLRYSSIGGLVQTVGSPSFTLSGLSPFFASSTTNTVQVQTFPNTTYDNITGLSGLVSGTTNASVRGLYLDPNAGEAQPLLAAKVRAH